MILNCWIQNWNKKHLLKMKKIFYMVLSVDLNKKSFMCWNLIGNKKLVKEYLLLMDLIFLQGIWIGKMKKLINKEAQAIV